MPFDPEKRQHKIETAGYRVDGDYSHAIPAHPEYNSSTNFDDAFYQERRDNNNKLVGLPVQPIVYPGEITIPQPPPGSVAIAFAYSGVDEFKAPVFNNVDKFYWLDNDGTITETTYTGTFTLTYAEINSHDGIAFYVENPANFKFFDDSGGGWESETFEFLPWTNTTALVNSANFGRYVESTTAAIGQLNYLDTSNWTSLNRFLYAQHNKKMDWDGMLGWDVSNVTDMTYLFRMHRPTMPNFAAAWDFTSVEIADSMFYGHIDPFPLWIETIQWGPNLTSMDNLGGGSLLPPEEDLSGEGRKLDLSNWCVTNITSKPYRFFYSLYGSDFEEVIHPVWGTCP